MEKGGFRPYEAAYLHAGATCRKKKRHVRLTW